LDRRFVGSEPDDSKGVVNQEHRGFEYVSFSPYLSPLINASQGEVLWSGGVI
jgi:hypothetical protein